MDSPEDEILYELWKHELSMKVSLDANTREYSLEHEFIVRYITAEKAPGLSRGEIQLFLSEAADSSQEQIDADKAAVFRLLS